MTDPTLAQINEYQNYLYSRKIMALIEDELIEMFVKGEASDVSRHGVASDEYKKISIDGDQEYNDEGGTSYQLSRLTVVYASGNVVLSWGNCETLFDKLQYEYGDILENIGTLKKQPGPPFNLKILDAEDVNSINDRKD